MLEAIVKKEIIFYVMGILVGIAVLSKVISSFTIRRMVKAAGEIQKSNHRLMKLIKAKFEHASMISDRVQNVEAFVDKYIYEYKVFGVRLLGWRSVPKKSLWIISILGVFAIFESYRIGGMSDLTLAYIQWTGLFVLFMLLLYFVFDENTRLEAAKNYMVEYFENVCIHRYAKAHHMAESTAEESEITAEEEQVKEEAEQPEEQELKQQVAEAVAEEQKKSEQEIRIRAILEEFMA